VNNKTDDHLSNPSRPRRKRPRRVRALWVLVALFFLLIMALIYAASARLTIEFGEGEPRNSAELAMFYPEVPPERNAALRFAAQIESPQWGTLRKAMKQETEFEARRRLLEPGADVKIGEGEFVTIAQGAAASTNVLEVLHQVLQLPESRFPIDLARGPYAEVPHLARIIEACKFEARLAAHFASAGDRDTSFDRVCDVWRLAALLKNEPFPVSQLSREACHEIGMFATAAAFSRASFADKQLQTLAALVAAERDESWLYESFLASRCLWIDTERGESLGSSLIRSQNDRYYFRYIGRVISSARLPRNERIAMLDAIRKEFKADFEHSIGPIQNMKYEAMEQLRAVYRIEEVFTRDLMQIDLTLVGIAIERYRVANGRAPESLDVLVPQYLDALPFDVFTDKTFIYRTLADGYIVYSIHGATSDESDNGGLSRNEARGQGPYDWPFKVSAEDAKKQDDEWDAIAARLDSEEMEATPK
jgi:hypothetical protein